MITKIVYEKRRFPGKNQPSIADIFRSGPIIILFFFGQTAWELLRDTLISLRLTVGRFLLRVVAPVLAFGATCVALLFFKEWFVDYYTHAQHHYLIFLELILILSVGLLWLVHTLMFEEIRQKEIWRYVFEPMSDMMDVFLFTYPFTLLGVKLFFASISYSFDPLFYATLVAFAILVFILLLATQTPVKPKPQWGKMSITSAKTDELQDRIKAVLNKFPVMKKAYDWWWLIFIVAGLIAFVLSPDLPTTSVFERFI